MEKNVKFCHRCGSKLPQIAAYCIVCGEKQISMDEQIRADSSITVEPIITNSQQKQKADPPPSKSTEKQNGVFETLQTTPHKDSSSTVERNERHFLNDRRTVLKATILCIAAILVFAMAFLPVIHLGVEDRGDVFVSLDFGIMDHITFMFDSFQNNKNIGDSSLVEDYKEIIEKVNMEYKEYINVSDIYESTIPPKMVKLLQDMIILIVRMELQTEAVDPESSVCISGIMSIAYFLFSLAFLFLAFRNFVVVVRGESEKSISKRAVVCLCIAPVFTLICFYSIWLAYLGHSAALSCWAIIILVLLFACVTGYATIYAIIEKKHSPKEVVVKAVPSILVLLTLCTLFLPILSVHVEKGLNENKNIPVLTACFDSFDRLDVQYKTYFDSNVMQNKKNLEKQCEFILGHDKYESETGEIQESVCSIMAILSTQSYFDNALFFTAMAQLPLLTLFIACLCGWIFVQNLMPLLLDAGKPKRTKLRLLLVLLSLIFLGAIIVCMISLNYAAGISKDVTCRLQINVGAILTLIFSLIVLSFSNDKHCLKNKENSEHFSEEDQCFY